MSEWHDAKKALASRLEGLVAEIVEGDDGDTVDRTIQAVFTDPPASIENGNLPCIVFGESSLQDEWDSALARERYELTCSLLMREEDAARGTEWTESWRDVVKAKLRKNLTILKPEDRTDGVHAGLFAGPSFTPADVIHYAGGIYIGFMFTFPVLLTVPVTYADEG